MLKKNSLEQIIILGILICLMTISIVVPAQKTIFIRPNASFNQTTIPLYIGDVLHNGTDYRETHQFYSLKSENNFFNLTITGDTISETLSKEEVKKRAEKPLYIIKGFRTLPMELIYQTEVNLNGFQGDVEVRKVKDDDAGMTYELIDFRLWKYAKGGLIVLSMSDKVEETGKHAPYYKLIKKITDNITFYTKAEIEAYDRQVTALYSLTVNPLPLRNPYRYKVKTGDNSWTHSMTYDKSKIPEGAIIDNAYNDTFRGEVVVSPTLKHRYHHILIEHQYGETPFAPYADDDRLLFTCRDENKGNITRKGTLVLLSDIGKEVKIPFSFEYNHQ